MPFHSATRLTRGSHARWRGESLPLLTARGELPCFRCCSSGRSGRGLAFRERKQTLVHFPMNGSPRASQQPPGGSPATPAPRTRMFGLENDFPTPSAPFTNCPKGNYLVSFPLNKTQELQCYCIKSKVNLAKINRRNIYRIITIIIINILSAGDISISGLLK